MIDDFSRSISYMRVSVTDRCNLRCIHCMPKEGIELFPHERMLSYEQIIAVAGAAANVGIKHIRLTGGEPLVRKGVEKLVEAIAHTQGIEDVYMTTNGTLLAPLLPELVKAGLKGVNISLNALTDETYRAVTGGDSLKDALSGLRAAMDEPGLVVKVNTVPMEENEHELMDIAALAKENPIAVRFIEMMPIGRGLGRKGLSSPEMLSLLEAKYGPSSSTDGPPGNGPSTYYKFKDFKGEIGLISAVSHKFCKDCNRIRLTADGKLKSCLQYTAGVDVKPALLAGDSRAVEACIRECIAKKPEGHCFSDGCVHEGRLMSQIGG